MSPALYLNARVPLLAFSLSHALQSPAAAFVDNPFFSCTFFQLPTLPTLLLLKRMRCWYAHGEPTAFL
jgi:hypothetical protein